MDENLDRLLDLPGGGAPAMGGASWLVVAARRRLTITREKY